MRNIIALGRLGCLTLALAVSAPAGADDKKVGSAAEEAAIEAYAHGRPPDPSRAWSLAAGGRIYDTWWEALDRKKPTETNPAYPKEGKRTGANTWRCVECHGWDYKGKDGLYGKGERFTGIKGIQGARNKDPAAIARMLRAAPHGYTPEQITDQELARVALWVSKGQHDVDRKIDAKTAVVTGDKGRGSAIFQTTCAACHGYDGRLLNWGTKDEPGYIGTEAKALPHEVLHKIRNSHPGAAMINLRAFSLQDAVDVLAYSQTLPTK